MLVLMSDKYLDVFDENENPIEFVYGADPELGFILVYTDLNYNKETKEFKVKSLKPSRIYCKFHYKALKSG